MCSGTIQTEAAVLCNFLLPLQGAEGSPFAAHLLPHATGFRGKYQEHNLPLLKLAATSTEQERLTSRILFRWHWKGQAARLD